MNSTPILKPFISYVYCSMVFFLFDRVSVKDYRAEVELVWKPRKNLVIFAIQVMTRKHSVYFKPPFDLC